MTSTQKLVFIRKHLRLHYKRLREIDPENIVGYRVGKKKTNGIFQRNFAIIFQVKKKIDLADIHQDNHIPKIIRIALPEGEILKVRTDVQQTGAFNFQNGLTGMVRSQNSPGNSYGSAGLFVTDDGQNTLMITNYHVSAENFLNDNIYYYRRDPGQVNQDVSLKTKAANQFSGSFLEGLISENVDIAFVEMSVRPEMPNQLPSGLLIQSRVTDQPLPAHFEGKTVTVYSYSSPQGGDATIHDVSTVLHTKHPGVSFIDLIQLSPKITQGGDSGSVVLTKSDAVLGIIVGADEEFSYAIPFYKIENFKSFNLL
ncbi:hypothetical protein DHW03_01665 [Pedobacter yonginense]|uniref:Serine protease n=1 Tax=Pedobacter yonginense TaxID=651869 RepID=A0A317ETL7_9SPHI|nr:hypothetical protein [Pedobacter yonginense]PWS28586.1 hypothetical protein DHW03_01665 [Pedobacter yonginense]